MSLSRKLGIGSKELAAKLKLAHYGGLVVTRALLDGQDKLPLEEAQQIIDQELQLHAKLQAALEFDLDANTAQQFLEVFLNYDLERKKLEFEREKFQLDCARAREQRINDRGDQDGDSSNADGEWSGKIPTMKNRSRAASFRRLTTNSSLPKEEDMLSRVTKAEIIEHLLEHCQRSMELPTQFSRSR